MAAKVRRNQDAAKLFWDVGPGEDFQATKLGLSRVEAIHDTFGPG